MKVNSIQYGKTMSKATCINLRERFGKRFKIEREESFFAGRDRYRAAEEVWLQIIPCRAGHIYPHGGDLLAASTDKAGQTARRLKALAGVTVRQDGDDGVTVSFPAEMFDQVGRPDAPKAPGGQPRPMTEEERRAFIERGRPSTVLDRGQNDGKPIKIRFRGPETKNLDMGNRDAITGGHGAHDRRDHPLSRFRHRAAATSGWSPRPGLACPDPGGKADGAARGRRIAGGTGRERTAGPTVAGNPLRASRLDFGRLYTSLQNGCH